ncbi:hypothetical protein CH063_10149, partial [Colletotrichum higginsianum]
TETVPGVPASDGGFCFLLTLSSPLILHRFPILLLLLLLSRLVPSPSHLPRCLCRRRLLLEVCLS